MYPPDPSGWAPGNCAASFVTMGSGSRDSVVPESRMTFTGSESRNGVATVDPGRRWASEFRVTL